MKRKASYHDEHSIYAAPALESTLLIDTGGVEDPNPIGNTPSTEISAAVSSGTRTFQYNRYFWNRELFSFNYKNNAVGVAIAYYSATLGTYSFAIYPIFLPRVAMTLLQSLSSSSPTEDPAARKLLLDQLIYYLNLGFTTGGTGNNYNIDGSGFDQYHFRVSPWVLASDARGSPNPTIVANQTFPVFQDGVLPATSPLIWCYSGNNSQLCLRVNTAFFAGRPHHSDLIGFQIVTLEDYFCNSPLVSTGAYSFVASNTFDSGVNFFPAQSYGDGTGWCCQGAFATGFGQTKNYTSFENVNASISSYTDIYTSAERLALFQATRFPVLTPNFITPLNFLANVCAPFKLVTNAPNSSGILLSSFITSMIPTRFVSISSDALTRNQKRPVSSNNPNLDPSTMAIQCITLDRLKTWTDDTLAGQTASAGSILFGSRKSGVDDCAVVSMDPMQSLQVLDLVLRDEWGNVIQNYNQQSINSPSGADPQSQVFTRWDGGGNIPGEFLIADWAAAFNPTGSSPESLLMNESWWGSVWQVYKNNPQSSLPNDCPSDFAPGMPQSTTMAHFGRVLGY